MAQASGEPRDIKTNPASSDFSVITGNTDSILQNASWPKQDDNSFTASEPSRPDQADEVYDSNEILASHYALATAYQRVTKKLAEAELRNQQLAVMQDSLRGQDNFRSARMSGSAGSQTNYAIHPDLEASVNEAWEAYSEKCKECQHLREELAEVRQKSNNSEHFSQIQNLQEDVLRQKAKQDDVVRRLEKTKMEADHLEKKEILAREELEKEREYQKSIIEGAERKHRELEQRIEELENSLTNEKSLTEDLRRREKDRQKLLEDEYNVKKEGFTTKIRQLEEQNISLKEEVAVLVSMQANTNGPTSGNLLSANGPIDSGQASSSVNFDDEKDAAALEFDVQVLRTELNDLKLKAAEQKTMLQALCQNPKLHQLLWNANREDSGLPPSLLKSGPGSMPVQSSNGVLLKRKKTNSPKMVNHASHSHIDGHTVSGYSSMNSQYTYGPDIIPKQACIPPKIMNEGLNPQNTASLKTTEEFIRGLSQEGTMQNRRTIRPPHKPENVEVHPVFPPMDVSRTIHTPESGEPRTMPPLRTPPATYGVQSQNINGNGTVHMRPITNGQPYFVNTNRNSLPAMDEDSSTFLSAVSSNSLSSTDTLVISPVSKTPNVRPTNPVPKDTQSAITPTSSAARVPSFKGVTDSSNINPMEMEDENPQSSRHLDTNFDTPGNRYISSDEDNSSFECLEPRDNRPHQPKEFVVPKVVRAANLPGSTAQRKAFQDSRYNVPAAPTQARPAIRAKPEVAAANQPGSRNIRHDNGPANVHKYPDSRPAHRNQEDAALICPVCDMTYPTSWTEERKRVHVNGHFSDEDNNPTLAAD